ncbi:ComEA family DNA-binding protein [Sphaerotilus sp.]|uniref:ComEA family DNA-binding protein n=1 Tax=Sphaerotilus sp. TaxID=2093942 RepID=UPI0034E2FD53
MTFLTAPRSSDLATDSAEAAPHIAGVHGYRLDGDQITLWAEIAGGPAEVLLALWAQPADATDAGSRILVAQIRSTLHGDSAVLIEEEVPAALPSGQADWQMVLTLSVPDTGGLAVERDLRVFAMTQSFLQPKLVVERPLVARSVVVGVQIDSVAVTNPRPATNLSGSLCLELWALAQPYAGGAFAGQCLGTVNVGQLGGQTGCECLGETWSAPADAAAVLVLMLREWTQDGLLTRDHHRVTLAAQAPAASVVAPLATPVEARAAAPVATARPKARPAHLLNVNLATEEQLVAIDGLNRALAKAVVAARPFASIDDLLDIKGVGDKRLARMRRHLCV